MEKQRKQIRAYRISPETIKLVQEIAKEKGITETKFVLDAITASVTQYTPSHPQ